MKIEEQLTIIFSILILLFGDVVLSAEPSLNRPWQCKESKVDGLLSIDCSNHNNEIYIPNDLNKNVQILNLSRNVLQSIKGDDFAIYKELVRLDLSNCLRGSKRVIAYEVEQCFLPLTKLQYLDVSQTCLASKQQEPHFPKTIETFVYENCVSKDELELYDIESLRLLRARNSRLKTFPDVYIYAPLEKLDVRRVGLDEATYEEIARLCLLREILFEQDDNTGIQNKNNYCACHRLEGWINDTEIVTPNRLNCSVPDSLPHCSTEYPQELLKRREECFEMHDMEIINRKTGKPSKGRKRPRQWSTRIIIAAVVIVVVLGVIALIALLIWEYKNIKRAFSSPARYSETGDGVNAEEQSEPEERVGKTVDGVETTTDENTRD